MKSQYGNRETVGTTYLESQKNTDSTLLLEDINDPMVKDFVVDLNDTIQSDPYDGKPFYINVVEERDLQMKNAFKRRLFTTLYRPYPEDNTLVYYTEPKNERTYFCWDVPHHSELYNILSNFTNHDGTFIRKIREWMDNDLTNFGFVKVSMNNETQDGYDQKILDGYRDSYLNYLKAKGMDEKSLESEKRLGFFWIPNKNFKYQNVTAKKTPKLFT